jgi:hypothetical protein
MDSIENIANFLDLDRHGKATLLAGKLGVPFSDNINELIYAIGAALREKQHKVVVLQADWKEVIEKCGIQRSDGLDCCLTSDDPAHCDNWPLRWAAANGHVEAVNTLLQDPRVDPAAKDNCAVEWAASNGHLEVVRLLLADKRVDPSVSGQRSIRLAVERGHTAVARLLLQDPRVSLGAAIAVAEKYGWEKTLAGLKKLKE